MSNTSLLGSFGGQAGDALMFRNRIINGDMRIDQRATATGLQAYTVDRWAIGRSDDATATWAQNTDAPSGFTHSLRQTITTADASIAATQFNGIFQIIEGFNIADFAWGTSAARPINISFWVRSSVIGQYTGNVRNKDDTRICPFNYSISAANTWEFKTVTIPGCPDGTWLTNNDAGLRLQLYVAMGSTYLGGVDGAWNSTTKYGSGTPVNGLNANGNIFAITGVQLESGTATPFERRPIGTELALCQRYYEVGPVWNFIRTNSNTSFSAQIQFAVAKRSTAVLIAKSSGTYLIQANASTWGSGNNSNVGTITVSQIYSTSEYGAILDYTSTGNVQYFQAGSQFMFCSGGPFWTASSEL